jgi:hypothetical protein
MGVGDPCASGKTRTKFAVRVSVFTGNGLWMPVSKWRTNRKSGNCVSLEKVALAAFPMSIGLPEAMKTCTL